MTKKRLIPFNWLPGHWGMTGKTRQLAEAEYTLMNGEELDRRKLEINLSEKSDAEIKLETLKLDLKYKHITDEEYDRKTILASISDEKEQKLALLKVDKKYGNLTDAEFDKKKAVLNEEPYVRVAKIETDPTNPAFGGIILDWNEAFVNHLEENGYGPHPIDEETVNEWFNELCKNVALEAFDGLGDFSEKMGGPRKKKRTSVSDDALFHSDIQKQDNRDDHNDV